MDSCKFKKGDLVMVTNLDEEYNHTPYNMFLNIPGFILEEKYDCYRVVFPLFEDGMYDKKNGHEGYTYLEHELTLLTDD